MERIVLQAELVDWVYDFSQQSRPMVSLSYVMVQKSYFVYNNLYNKIYNAETKKRIIPLISRREKTKKQKTWDQDQYEGDFLDQSVCYHVPVTMIPREKI